MCASMTCCTTRRPTYQLNWTQRSFPRDSLVVVVAPLPHYIFTHMHNSHTHTHLVRRPSMVLYAILVWKYSQRFSTLRSSLSLNFLSLQSQTLSFATKKEYNNNQTLGFSNHEVAFAFWPRNWFCFFFSSFRMHSSLFYAWFLPFSIFYIKKKI